MHKGLFMELKKPTKRPKKLYGSTYRTVVGCGKLYITINESDSKVQEVFAKLSKSGSCTAAMCEAITRMVTLVFRMGGDPSYIAKHLEGIRCPEPKEAEDGKYLSCADAIGKIIDEHIKGEKDDKNRNDK